LALTNSPLQKLIDAEKKAVAKARSLEADLAAVCSVIAAETQRQAEEVLADVHERDDRERDRQAELIREAAAAFTDLVEAYSRLLQAAEKHDRGREQARAKLPPNLQHHLDGPAPRCCSHRSR
jgi:hypothetical protein